VSQPNGISIRFTLLTLALGLLAVAMPLFFVINNAPTCATAAHRRAFC
jgi:hypothetical protein